MTSEESLLRRFRLLLERIEEYGQNIERRINPEESRRLILETISELEQIGIVKVAVERRIEEIMQKVREKTESIIKSNLSFTTTEQDIQRLLTSMKNEIRHADLRYVKSSQITQYCVQLRAVNVQEEDLVKANERVMEILERLVRAAEKLE